MADMLSVPPAPQAPPGPQDSAPAANGRDPEGPPFKQVLDDHQARTADAEGPTGGDDKPKGTDCDDKATTPDGTTATAQPDATAQALALALTAAAPATAKAETAAATAVPATEAAAATTTTAAAVAAATDAVAAPAAKPADVPATATVPADAATTDAPAVVATPELPTGDHAGRQDGQAKPQSAAAAAVAQALIDVKPATTQPAQAQASAQPAAATPAQGEQAAPAAEKAPEAPVVAQPQAAPATVNPTAGAQVNRQAPAPPVAAPSPLNTAHAVERIQAMVHLAHARGNAHARLELHPAELGGVTIQLQVRHDGLHAHIAADRAEALPLLERAAGDLQRTLESRGIDLRGLDFGLAPDAEAGASRDDGRAQRRPGSTGADAAKGADDDADDEIQTVTTSTHAVELPAGALVDVRA